MLHTETLGNGPDIIFLHGLFGAGDNWRTVGRALSEQYRVHLIDLPNHGRSDWLEEPELENLASIINQWISDNNIQHYNLLGHSMGGKVAMQMALNAHPGVMEKLVVVDISPKEYPKHHQAIFKALHETDLSQMKDRKSVDDAIAHLVTDTGVRQFLLKSLYKKEGQLAWRFNFKTLEEKYQAVADAPTSSQTYDQPTLFIKGMNSHYISEQDRELILSLFPNAQAKIIEGAGHWPHAEKPAAFLKILSDFLAQST
ncbi:alpha/beta fold hydrolase [Reinekea thalattae]|uniref:Alpha/beta fold hydrolase n=1 Tax=Reinekea thalattae TaxID=2593301 RepID=A0A5C8Z891_9GAMM|nr:alpha/beta fold hydrolase [Reinekea thalattae]TXR53066.1 alpha/beta fold hydrolase [Reinekea thalattae]